MKKSSLVSLLVLLVGVVAYGYETGNWENNPSYPETWTSGALGIGTSSPEQMLHIKSSYPKIVMESSRAKWWMYARPQDNSFRISDLNASECRLMINNNGYVGIGKTSPDNMLDVNGTIRAKEIKVETGWSDFVFADSYKLMPLDKLEKHIKVNKSLPGIPTEKEVLENGIELGKMQAKFLEKIEELTLYVIDLKKENKELKERISILEK